MKPLCSLAKKCDCICARTIDGGKICVICLSQNLIQFPSAKRSVHPNMIEGHGSMVGRMKQVINLLESQYDWYCAKNRFRYYYIPMLSLLCKPISTNSWLFKLISFFGKRLSTLTVCKWFLEKLNELVGAYFMPFKKVIFN